MRHAILAVLGFLNVGCGGIYHSRLVEFETEASASIDPQALQAWAVATLEAHESYQENISLEKTPSDIRNLTFEEQTFKEALFLEAKDDSGQYILFLWGGTFAHWGLAVGPQNLTLESDARNLYNAWIPGVFFWHEIQN